MNKIGIRHEDKYTLERRTPVVPDDVRSLIKESGIRFTVESSEKRIFSDAEYRDAGAEISDNLQHCDVIFGVKEMPENYFRPYKVYVFFSHVIKGQPYNMTMLRNLMNSGSTLIDYEKIEDEKERRLIFFGEYAGLAGMINSLWSVGQRYKELGIDNPFTNLKQAYRYNSLEEAKEDIRKVGEVIANNGLPDEMTPLVIAVTGDGNVSRGALDILNLVPGKEVTAEQLQTKSYPKDEPVIKVNILPQDYMVHKQGEEFDLWHYIDHPELYRSVIEDLLTEINVFVNGIYWDDRYPKLIKKSWLKKMHQSGELKLTVIGDITCDVHGSVECTEKATEIEDPVFVYNPANDDFEMGFAGEGVAVMAVDILPSELPREASEHFSSALKPFMKPIADADFSKPFGELQLPEPLKRATIVYRGELTPGYEYLRDFL